MDLEVDSLLSQAMAGDSKARENLIQACRTFVHKTACTLANHGLEWGRDDELSIALIALNEAIDVYQPEKKVPFLAFARIVIQSRLKDFWRKENRFYQTTIPIIENSENNHQSALEVQSAWNSYWDQLIIQERGEEIQRFNLLLKAYNIKFSELVDVSPQHHDSRQTILGVAMHLAQNPLLMEYLRTKKKLPVQELADRMGVNRKTIERRRKYLIALALILHHPEEFIYLKSYLQIPTERGSHDE